MSSDWSGFHCEHADFTVRSVPAGDEFRVRRDCLIRGSEVFRDMFQCCDSSRGTGGLDAQADALDLHESPAALNMLFHLLHSPPAAYEPPPPRTGAGAGESESASARAHDGADYVHIRVDPPAAGAIPFPLLPALLALADKYAVCPAVARACASHLAAHAPTQPLRVYGMAAAQGLAAVAARASTFLLHPPLAAYSADDVRVIPSAAAYHALVRLHAHRVRRLRELLDAEAVFPQGYGACGRHAAKTAARWAGRKASLVGRIEAATDVAAEMMVDSEELGGCETCCKAWRAATSMLGYKCSKIPRRIDELPACETQ